jgi:Glycosyltransferase like family
LISFGAAIRGAEAYSRYAEPGLRMASEPDSEVLAYASIEPIARTYNLILEAAAANEDLEALVLVHPHTEIVDESFCAKVRQALAGRNVGAVSCSGATGVRSIAWWEGSVVSAPVRLAYEEHGGGEVPSLSWTTRQPPPAEVEALDGQLLVLSPWAVHNLRFDESLLLGHGFDLDFGLQVRRAGRKLMVADLRVAHHRSLELISDLEVWVEAHIRVARKWGDTLHGTVQGEAAWKRRARRAEAQREAARTVAFSELMKLDARMLELERALEQKTGSASWKATAPLRAVNRIRLEASARRDGR